MKQKETQKIKADILDLNIYLSNLSERIDKIENTMNNKPHGLVIFNRKTNWLEND